MSINAEDAEIKPTDVDIEPDEVQSNYEYTNATIKSENASIKSENTNIKPENTNIKSEIVQSNPGNTSNDDHYEGYTEKSNEDLQYTIEHMEKSNKDLQKSNESMGKNIKILQQEYERLEQSNENFRKAAQDHRNSKKDLEGKLAGAESRIFELQQTNEHMEKSNKDLQKSNESMGKNIKILQQENERLEQSNENFRKDVQDHRNSKKDLEEKLAGAESRTFELQSRMLDRLSQLDAANEANRVLENRNIEFDEQIKQLEKSLSGMLDRSSQLDAANEANKLLENRIIEYDEQIKQLKKSLAKKEEDRPEIDLDVSGDSSDESSVEDKKDAWSIQFKKLRCYRGMKGDCKVPSSYEQDRSLGKWVSKQREGYNNARQGKKGWVLNPERIAKLDSIDFYWGKKYEEKRPSFEEYLDELKDFKDIFGHCNVPPTQGLLGKFVSRVRGEFRRYKKGKGSLFKLEEFKQLHSLGFSFKCK